MAKRLAAFRRDVMLSKLRLLSMLRDLKEKGARIVGISAPSRASTLVNYVGLDDGIIDYVCEIPGSLKIGKCMPGTQIPVVDEARLFADQPDCAIIFSWHIADELAPKLKAKGFRGQADHAAAGATVIYKGETMIDWPKINVTAHHQGLAVDGDHRARSRIRARRQARTLSCGRPAGLHRHRRAHAGRANSDRDGNTVRRWSASPGNCRPGWSTRAKPPRGRCRRELLEETGFPAEPCMNSAAYAPCTARLSNRVHSFFVETGPRADQPADRGRHRAQAGDAAGTGRADPGRRIRAATCISAPCCSPACAATSTSGSSARRSQAVDLDQSAGLLSLDWLSEKLQ